MQRVPRELQVFCAVNSAGKQRPQRHTPWRCDPAEHEWPNAAHSHDCRAEGSLGCGHETGPLPELQSHILFMHTGKKETRSKENKNTTKLVFVSVWLRLLRLIPLSWDILALISPVPTWDPYHSGHMWGLKLNSSVFLSLCFNTDRKKTFKCQQVCSVRFPTSISVSPEDAVPDNKATSCLANVRGEEESCILGIV